MRLGEYMNRELIELIRLLSAFLKVSMLRSCWIKPYPDEHVAVLEQPHWPEWSHSSCTVLHSKPFRLIRYPKIARLSLGFPRYHHHQAAAFAMLLFISITDF